MRCSMLVRLKGEDLRALTGSDLGKAAAFAGQDAFRGRLAFAIQMPILIAAQTADAIAARGTSQ